MFESVRAGRTSPGRSGAGAATAVAGPSSRRGLRFGRARPSPRATRHIPAATEAARVLGSPALRAAWASPSVMRATTPAVVPVSSAAVESDPVMMHLAGCWRSELGRRSLEGRAMLLDERLERHRRTAAELLDEVVRALEDPVLVVDRDLPAGAGTGRNCSRPACLPARLAGPVLNSSKSTCLYCDVLAQDPAQDLGSLLVGVFDRAEERVDLRPCAARGLRGCRRSRGPGPRPRSGRACRCRTARGAARP